MDFDDVKEVELRELKDYPIVHNTAIGEILEEKYNIKVIDCEHDEENESVIMHFYSSADFDKFIELVSQSAFLKLTEEKWRDLHRRILGTNKENDWTYDVGLFDFAAKPKIEDNFVVDYDYHGNSPDILVTILVRISIQDAEIVIDVLS